MLALKNYQQRALDVLREYFQIVNQTRNANTAFYQVTSDHDARGRGSIYNPVPQLPGLPYVCLRIPTGGGKTLMACHAVAIATQNFLRQERSVVLWLVPTNTIKDQTLAALRERTHPYRQALDTTLDALVTVMDLSEALSVQRATLDSTTTIIVSTLAAPRVEDTESRKVYEPSGALMSHFDGLPDAVIATLDKYEGSDKPIPSLANVLKMRRPIVTVDEAHNARTELAFDTLARFNPACILEFTATPTQPPQPNASNVLYHVSAYELKAEDMIKLPIHLQTHSDWKDAIAAAIAKRAELEQLATNERAVSGDYLRPIVLLQAQPRRQVRETLTVETVKGCLIDLGVPDAQIAIETGELREVKQWEEQNKKNLFDESCPIRFIITVQALREGWDCPFAYVLCSVAEMSSRTAVEQILGRVLRMPKAKRKQREDLNNAYAFVTSQHFKEAAEGLADALTANGFTHFEAVNEIAASQPTMTGFDLPLFDQARPPAERGERLAVPQLAVWVNGELEVIEESHFLDTAWELVRCDATLTEDEFATQRRDVDGLDLDVNAQGQVTLQRSTQIFVSALQQQLRLLIPQDITTAAQLAVWLDRHIPHPDITQTQAQLFLMRLVEYLLNERGLTIEQLSSDRLRLRDAAERKIEKHRRAVIQRAYQHQLFGDGAKEIEVSPQCVFTYDPNKYAANRLDEGMYPFRKHYYRAVGAMNDEEARCAQVIDSLPNVKYWVRNVERDPNYSFWMQTASDKFYPDFVALLNDERVLAVEYKGSHLLTNDDTKEKRRIGELWQARSKEHCMFQLVSEGDYESRLRATARN